MQRYHWHGLQPAAAGPKGSTGRARSRPTTTPNDPYRGDALLHERTTILLLAVGLFGAVTVLCFAAGGDDSSALSLLYTLPIGLLGMRDGWRGGVVAAAVGVGLLGVRDAVADADIGAIDYLTHTSTYLVVGGAAAFLAGKGLRIQAGDTRWFEMSNDMLVEASLDGHFTRLSERWEQCLGWTREELMARPFREFVHPDDLAATVAVARSLDERPSEVVNFENRYRTKDGEWRWLLWSARSDEHRKYAVARDITDRKRVEQERDELLGRVEAMARTDTLTGLPNRRSWDEEARRAIASAQRQGRPLALAMVDLDHFKLFNDEHGHAAGDSMLVEAAARWRMTLRATDFLARYGGEEFAVLLPDCEPGEAEGLLDRLRAATPESQTCSIGIAFWDRSDRLEDLVARADAALYEAKRQGRDRVITSAEADDRSGQRRTGSMG